jgi:para-aminobenzoate synthetase component 1
MSANSPMLEARMLTEQVGFPLAVELRPAPDAWDAFLRLAHLPHALFLDSAAAHPSLGRYSYVTADPFAWFAGRGSSAAGQFKRLANSLSQYRCEASPDLPPFQGGAAGLFGYDLCHQFERLPYPKRDEFEVPDLAVGLYDWVVAFDHVKNQAWLKSTGFPEIDERRRSRRANQRLRSIGQLLQSSARSVTGPYTSTHSSALTVGELHPQHAILGRLGVTSNFDHASYLSTVRHALEYIHAGDCYQVNLAQRLLHPATVAPIELYRRLRERNPAPFAGYFDASEFVIAGASPERFLHVHHGEVETRPIKGTRSRGATPAEDQAQIMELLVSPKDRSENVMIVDLLRNDLGRVCRYGSVRVPAVCRLESYRTVHHLVSEVRGVLQPSMGPIDLLRAAFPGGSVTGAPKIRAMEIIAELEPTARGPYCGSLGYIGFDGAMDTNILIRSFTIGRGWVQFPVGGGIVADSDPEREYEETWHKAEGLFRALQR